MFGLSASAVATALPASGAVRFVCLLLLVFTTTPAFGQIISDPSLKLQTWVRGLNKPTGAAFVDGGNTALVIEKDTGRVQFVQDRVIRGTALDLPVSSKGEQGLLGITLSPGFAADKQVYLYYTHADVDGGAGTENRVERFTWTGSKLTFDRRILRLPAVSDGHVGGKLTFGRDGKLYVAVGNMNLKGQTNNDENESNITASGAILRVNPSGSIPSNNPFSNPKSKNSPLNKIYAYGVRNCFGIGVDPVSGRLWETENGPKTMDEINFVTPGFNSGYSDVMGPVSRGGSIDNLVSLGSKAHYEDPQLAWAYAIAPTDVFFLETTRLGRQYRNDMFIGTVRGSGSLLHFDLTRTRNRLRLDPPLQDGVADNGFESHSRFLEMEDHIFGAELGTVTDLLAGPGGMYVVSFSRGLMYRITTRDMNARLSTVSSGATRVPEPGAAWLAVVAVSLSRLPRRHRDAGC